MELRPATIADVPAMGRLINDAAEFGLMLPKSAATLYENVREFRIAADQSREESGHAVVGVAGLSVIWADLAEIVSLVVAPAARGTGLGRRLVEDCVDEARRLGISRVMALTYEQAFFERLGFGVVDREHLPLKVWADCVRCPKHDACDEIAMVRVLEDVPAPPEAPQLPATPEPSFEVPVVMTATAAGRRPGPA
ncbi:MAG: N-acetyltransferase [Planctomycetota bacterium]